jgi:hypothetical protein
VLESKRESCSDWQNASVLEGGNEFRRMYWQRIQKVFRARSSQKRFFVRLGRNRSYQRSGMGAQYATHPLHTRWSEFNCFCLRFLVSVGIKIAF